MKKILLFSFIFLLISFENAIAGQHLYNANQSFSKHDYESALSSYQQALEDLSNQSIPVPTPSFFKNVQNKIASALNVISSSSTTPVPIPIIASSSSSVGVQDISTYALVCHNMGECYLQRKNINAAVSIWGVGADKGGESATGLKCRFKEGQYKMYSHDYLGAYQNLKQYLGSYIKKDKSQYDRPRMSAALYMASVSAWKLNRSGVQFEKNIVDAFMLKYQVQKLIPEIDTRIYFNKP